MRGRKIFAILFVSIFSAASYAQGPARGRIEAPRDEIKEIEAKHNLQVARYYLTRRKAYEGARDRLQEIIDTYPEFSRMDEVFLLMAEAQVKLGKKEAAMDYYRKLLEIYPESEHAKKAREQLDKLKQG
ncbi:MAG: outer membrane protein assembly factor BamD [Acidobacteriota bacterium]